MKLLKLVFVAFVAFCFSFISVVCAAANDSIDYVQYFLKKNSSVYVDIKKEKPFLDTNYYVEELRPYIHQFGKNDLVQFYESLENIHRFIEDYEYVDADEATKKSFDFLQGLLSRYTMNPSSAASTGQFSAEFESLQPVRKSNYTRESPFVGVERIRGDPKQEPSLPPTTQRNKMSYHPSATEEQYSQKEKNFRNFGMTERPTGESFTISRNDLLSQFKVSGYRNQGSSQAQSSNAPRKESHIHRLLMASTEAASQAEQSSFQSRFLGIPTGSTQNAGNDNRFNREQTPSQLRQGSSSRLHVSQEGRSSEIPTRFASEAEGSSMQQPEHVPRAQTRQQSFVNSRQELSSELSHDQSQSQSQRKPNAPPSSIVSSNQQSIFLMNLLKESTNQNFPSQASVMSGHVSTQPKSKPYNEASHKISQALREDDDYMFGTV